MKVTISFKHLDHTKALDDRIMNKTNRLKKYLDGNVDVKWICYLDEGVHHADIQLFGPTFHYQAKAGSKNMYKTFDMALSKLEKQLSRKKAKWKNKIHHKHEQRPTIYLDPESAWADYDEEWYDDVA